MTQISDDIDAEIWSELRGQRIRKRQDERAAKQQADEQAFEAEKRKGQAMIAQLAQRWRVELVPLYKRRADAHLRGDLDDALECETLMQVIHNDAMQTINGAVPLLHQASGDIVAQLRRDVGVPAAHDSLNECPTLSPIRRVIARGMASGLIGPNGVGHPNMKGLIQL